MTNLLYEEFATKPKTCHQKYPLFVSPVAQRTNWFINEGNGVLIRSVDVFDYENLPVFFKKALGRPSDTILKYLPASFLHASMRVPNAIFYDRSAPNAGVAVVAGTHYKRNNPNGQVDCTHYYPSDAGSMNRGLLEDPPKCIPERTMPVCVNGTCIATNTSACGECHIPGNMTGWMLGQYVQDERRGKRIHLPIFYNCWYHDMKEVIAASNAMWRDHDLWFRYHGDYDEAAAHFDGWSECTASLKITSPNLLDAMVLDVGSPMRGGRTLCDHPNATSLHARLQLAFESGLGSLPVLLYRETRGMRKVSDCERLWGGVDCGDGWMKEFFSEEFDFDNGACLRRPSGCSEVYYYPVCNDSRNSSSCSSRESQSTDQQGEIEAEGVNNKPNASEAHYDFDSEAYKRFEQSRSQSCSMQNPPFISPVARMSNGFLFTDTSSGRSGALIASGDTFEVTDSGVANTIKGLKNFPASLLHASMRAPNAVVEDIHRFSILIGSKYKRNTETFEGTEFADCLKYYPMDAATIRRGELDEPPTCLDNLTMPVCVNGTCLAREASGCGECQVEGNITGWLFKHYTNYTRKGKAIENPATYVCYYQDAEETVQASNSLWQESEHWFSTGKDSRVYPGWTECAATVSIHDKSMVDAIVVPLSTPKLDGGSSLCEHFNTTSIDERLRIAFESGYGSFPVLFYQESLGMQLVSDCFNLWGGVDCEDGWQKQFFSQEFAFNSGACLDRPSDCEEVYYFPDCTMKANFTCDEHPGTPPLVDSMDVAALTDRSRTITKVSLCVPDVMSSIGLESSFRLLSVLFVLLVFSGFWRRRSRRNGRSSLAKSVM